MAPLSLSMAEFSLDIQIQVSLKQAQGYLFKKQQKHTNLKIQVSKATLSIMRLFPSLDIHNNSLNTKVQKYNETETKKLQTKVLDPMIR